MFQKLCILFLCLAPILANEEHCPKWDGIEVDPKKMIEGMRKGWYFPLLQKIDLKPSELSEEIPHDPRHWNHKECTTITSTAPLAVTMDLWATASYNTTSLMRGTSEYKGNVPVGEVSSVSMYADMKVVLSDQKDYYLCVFCFFGRHKYWAVLSPHEKISDAHKKLVLDHVVKIGFPNKDIEEKDSTTLKPHMVKLHGCDEEKEKPKGEVLPDTGIDLA